MRPTICTLIGDSDADVESLVSAFCSCRDDFTPAHPMYVVETKVPLKPRSHKPVRFRVCVDSGKQEEEECQTARQRSYRKTDIIMLCFSTMSRSSWNNVVHKWLPEIHHFRRKIPFILVGTHRNLRPDEEQRAAEDVGTSEDFSEEDKAGPAVVYPQEVLDSYEDLGASAFLDCTAMAGSNLQAAMKGVLTMVPVKRRCCRCCL